MVQNTSVLLARRPQGNPQPEDFKLETSELPAQLEAGQLLLKNHFVSLDAGFRNWMDEGAGDEVLPAMPIDAPVMGLVLGEVLDSAHDEYAAGEFLMARLFWQQYTVTDASDFLVKLPTSRSHPPSYYLGVLGDTGMSGYFGMRDIGQPQPGETVLVSAAGGAVGSIAGQIARIMGARAVGIAGGAEKCGRLVAELGYAAAIDHRGDVQAQLEETCPDGVDVYFDNVGGPLLEDVLERINVGARIALCGAVADYGNPRPGPSNLFQLVTREAKMQGFFTHTQVERYPEAREALSNWVTDGELVVPEYRLQGIEQVGPAFCDLFAGRNFGKTVVEL